MYKARRSGMKREMFGYVPGGYKRILQVLGDALQARGATIATSSPVTRVVRDEASQQLLVTCGQGANQRVERFDRVVMTAPSPIVERACEGLNADERARLTGASIWGLFAPRCCSIGRLRATMSRTSLIPGCR